MIQRALAEINDHMTLDNKNADADKLVLKTDMRRTMQDLVAPVVEQGVKHKE